VFRRVIVVLALFVLTSGSTAAQAPSRDFDRYVTAAMRAWKVPGLAVAIVKNDSVVYAKGYGVRTLGTEVAVDPTTLFAIGSSSKAFTAAAVGILVDAKRVAWDDRVSRHLPGFALFDDYANQQVTVRDILSHRSGLSRGDLLWYGTDLDRAEIVRRVRFLEPSWSFRSQFGYQNIMFLTAGQLVESVSGQSWDDFVRERIFEPLGMRSTNTSTKALAGLPNVATPHAEIDDTVRTVAWRNIDNIAPAGSINSNVLDMAQWVRLHLNQGEIGGKRILSSSVVAEMQKPNTIIPFEGVSARLYSESNFLSYGLAWFLQDHRGRKVVQHGGNIDGMSALVAMMPSEKVGLVILTNMNGTSLPTALMYRIFDAYLGVEPKDWSGDILKAIQPLIDAAKAQQKKTEDARVTGTSPSHTLADYAGTFADPDSLYGEEVVGFHDGVLTLSSSPAFQGILEHWHYDTFRAIWKDPMLGKSLVTFSANHEGKINKMQVEGVGEFTRKPEVPDSTDAVELSEAQLRRLAGKYRAEQPPIDASVEFFEGYLQVVIPGQPAYRLAADSRTKFHLTGIPIEVTLEFQMEGETVKSVILTQQGRSFTLARIEGEI